MEFFRKHRKAITLIIGLSFVMWTVGMMILAVLAYK